MARRTVHPAVGREPTDDHKAFAEFITKTTKVEIPAEAVALTMRLLSEYRKSPAKQKAVAAKQKAREAEKAEIARRKAERVEAKRQRLLAQLAALDTGNSSGPHVHIEAETDLATVTPIEEAPSKIVLTPAEDDEEVEPDVPTVVTIVSDDEFDDDDDEEEKPDDSDEDDADDADDDWEVPDDDEDEF